MKRLFFVPVLASIGLAIASPATAQIGRPDWNYADEARQPYNEARRFAYDNGYREGLKEGQNDARRRETFDYQDERTWQRADRGYHRSYGDRFRYEQAFRTGFAAGYSDAYRSYAPNYGYGRPGGVYPNSRDDYRYGYPGSGDYRSGYPGAGDYRYGYSPALNNGVTDGYEKGREDARDRDSYDVRRHKWYRDGDRHYRNEYGPRRQYEDLYRQGFREGYDRGYREWAYRR